MFFFMWRGLRGYNKVQPNWSKTKSMFVVQTIAVVYLEVNEFTGRNIRGFYLILIWTSYSLFLTFSITLDSCQTKAQLDNKNGCIRSFNWIYRVLMHLVTFLLLLGTLTIKPCDDELYPHMFIGVVATILIHQAVDIFLWTQGYLVDWENLPGISPNKIRFNRPLFEKQMKFLFVGNLIFGTVSMVTVYMGYHIMNEPH